MTGVRTTYSSGDSFEEFEKMVDSYLDSLVAEARECIHAEFNDESDKRYAEISLSVSSKLLELHLKRRARNGKLPTS